MKYATIHIKRGTPAQKRKFSRIVTQEYNRYLNEHPEEVRRMEKKIKAEFMKQAL